VTSEGSGWSESGMAEHPTGSERSGEPDAPGRKK